MAVDVRPLSTVIGAEIRGIDPAGHIDDDTIADNRQAWLDVTTEGRRLKTQRAAVPERLLDAGSAHGLHPPVRSAPHHARLANEAPVTLPDHRRDAIEGQHGRRFRPHRSS